MIIRLNEKTITFKGIIFDMDGVVIDSEKAWVEATKELLIEYKMRYDLTEELKKELFGMPPKKGAELLVKELKIPCGPEEFYRKRKEKVKAKLSEGVPEIKGFMEFYKRITTPIILVTASPEYLIQKIKINGSKQKIADLFTKRISVTTTKKDPGVWREAAERIGVPIEDTIVLEDSHHGLEGARKAGAKTIGITTSFSELEADHIINNYDEIIVQGRP